MALIHIEYPVVSEISTTEKLSIFKDELPIAATILYKLNVIIQIVQIFGIHDKFDF